MAKNKFSKEFVARQKYKVLNINGVTVVVLARSGMKGSGKGLCGGKYVKLRKFYVPTELADDGYEDNSSDVVFWGSE